MEGYKEHLIDRGYDCCDGVTLCLDCDYYISTSHYHPKYRPRMETWYQKETKKTEEKIREYFKKQEKKKKKVEIPF